MNELEKIPYQGIGIGLRTEIIDETFAHEADIEVVEIISESYFSNQKPERLEFLDRAMETFNVIPHGVKLSIGSNTPTDEEFLSEVKQLCDKIKAPYYSDHFCITKHDSTTDIGHLSPIWYTKENLALLIDKVNRIQQYTGLPLVLENITAPFIIPESDYEEHEFISKVCEATGCGLLLDVTNVFINAHNFKQDPQQLIEKYPMDKVVHIHVAGGTIDEEGKYHDTHSARVHEGVWPLLEWVVKNANVKTYIIERDQDFDPDFNELVLEDLSIIKEIVRKAKTA